MANTRSQTLSEILANIFQNNAKAITGTIMQTVLVDMANAYANIETDVVGLNDFSATKQYVVGNTVVYSGSIYRANTSHLGAWNAANFDAITGAETIQSIYDASTFPLLTSDAVGGFIIQNGQSSDTNTVFEVQNIAGSPTFTVGGNGIVANGNWQADTIAAGFGGTGYSSFTVGDMLYASSTSAFGKLGIGTSGQVLTVSGGLPSWATISSSNIGSANLTITDNARYLRLKAGYSTTQYFQIQNEGGENFTKWLGDGTVQNRGQFFFNASTNGGQELYVIRAKSFGGFEKFRVQAEDNQGIVDIWGNQAYQLISLNSTSTSYFYNTLSIGSDTANASAILDITSTSKGFGLPSMTSAQRSAISSPKEGLLVYQNDGTEAIYGYVNSAWMALGSGNLVNVGTGTYTPNTSITGVTRTTVTVTVTGALTTDKVVANMNDAMRADFVTAVSYFLDMQAYVSAANTVTITYSVSTYTTFGASSSINVMVIR